MCARASTHKRSRVVPVGVMVTLPEGNLGRRVRGIEEGAQSVHAEGVRQHARAVQGRKGMGRGGGRQDVQQDREGPVQEGGGDGDAGAVGERDQVQGRVGKLPGEQGRAGPGGVRFEGRAQDIAPPGAGAVENIEGRDDAPRGGAVLFRPAALRGVTEAAQEGREGEEDGRFDKGGVPPG